MEEIAAQVTGLYRLGNDPIYIRQWDAEQLVQVRQHRLGIFGQFCLTDVGHQPVDMLCRRCSRQARHPVFNTDAKLATNLLIFLGTDAVPFHPPKLGGERRQGFAATTFINGAIDLQGLLAVF